MFGDEVINDVPAIKRQTRDDDDISNRNYGAHLPHQIPSTEKKK